MKRKSIYAIFLTLMLILSACGSNEKEDGITNGSNASGVPTAGSITASLESLNIDKSNGNIAANIQLTSGYNNGAIANLSNMSLTLGGCALETGSTVISPNSLTLDNATPTKSVAFTAVMTNPSCVPTDFYIKGTNSLNNNGETTETSFQTNTVNIAASSIIFENISLLKLEVLDKVLDINETGITKPIRVRVTNGGIGHKDQKIKITSLVIKGSFTVSNITSDSAGDATFEYISPTPLTEDSFTVDFCLEDNISVCDSAKINLTTGVIVEPVEPIDNINYFITFVPNGGANNLALGSRNNAIVTLIDKDTNQPIPNNNITGITVTSRDLSILKLTPEGGGLPEKSIQFGTARNGVSVLLTADKINSGLAVVEVIIEYKNLNGVPKSRGQLFTVAVLSGEPTAFSINSAGVLYNFLTKQFEHTFIVQATDLTGNPVSTTGVINVSAMASFAKDAAGREMLYGRHSGGISATLSPNNGKASLALTGATPFNTTNIKLNRAYVAIFGGVETYEANGKWSIENIVSANTLNLNNQYHGGAHEELGMAIGYNYRDKFCTSAFEESVVVVDSSDGKYLLDVNGRTFVTLKYDSYMIGKRAMVLVNMTGLNPNTNKVIRSGEVHETTLSFVKDLKGDSIKVPEGATNFPVTIWGIINTGTEDEWNVVNSTFSCALDLSKVTIVSGPEKNDPSSCDNNGRAFLRYIVSSTGEEGSVTFKDCQVDSEPNY